jgi:regulator of protease activity HflC (stomatin/prohibitin superfamily)
MLRRAVIHESHVGLLYRHGRFERLLGPGGHWLIGPGHEVVPVDLRRRLLVVSGQEVLTSDTVQVRASAVVAYRVADAPRALHEFDSYETELRVATQLALRTAAGEHPLDDLLEQRLGLRERLTALVADRAAELGLALHSVELRDLMLPGSIKSAFAEVLQARAEGRAALERARGESAALRNLANAARLLEDHPGLMQLRLLQVVAQDAALPGTTRFVVNLPDGTVAPSGDAD